MTSLYNSQEFYKKMLELQERLRKSEDERMKLEERFNLLSQDSRSRREACINNLRMRYIDFLEEQRLRDERNHQILGALDKIDGSLARMTARTDRLGILRKQYEAYLLRVYANRSAGGGTGDSGVGSHNEDRSPKPNILEPEKNLPSRQRMGSQNASNPSYLIPQLNYPQSHIGTSDISQFNVPRYTTGQETPQVQVMQAHGQGDGSTIVQPQLFYGSENQNVPNICASKTQAMPNTLMQEFGPSNRNYSQQILRSNSQLAPSSAQIQSHQFHGVSNQYIENPRSSYTDDPSMMRRRVLPDSQEIASSGLQSDRTNARGVADFSLDLIDEGFGPYRHSTPLPGYLDYSTRYSRDSSVPDPNIAARFGFTRSDLEKVIQKNEQILPRDYLHNPESVKPAMHTLKLSSPLEDKERTPDAKPSRIMNDDELDQYINRIRSLHRDNDQSLEALDIEQNTSGDLLNATLSDDGPELLTLHSEDKVKPNKAKILSEDVKNVFALADDFVAETANLVDESQFSNKFLNDREIPSKSVFSPQIRRENVVAEPMFGKSDAVSPMMLKADMASGNLSISATRDDILSGTASDGVNQIQDTSAIRNGKFKPKVTPLIADADTPLLNIADVATASQNNPDDPHKLSPNERGGTQILRSSSQEYLDDHDVRYPKELQVHEDIEGDRVSLIEGEQTHEQVIDVVKELQPLSLKHYEKKVVEIHVANDQKAANTGKLVSEGIDGHEIPENEDRRLYRKPPANDVAERLPQDSVAEFDPPEEKYSEAKVVEEQISRGSENERNEDLQYQDDPERKYELNQDNEHPIDENQSVQNLVQNVNENRDAGRMFEKNSDELYGPTTEEQLDYETRRTEDESNRSEQPYIPTSDEQYDSNQIYNANEQYETDPSQQYPQESDPQFAYVPHENFEDHPNVEYEAGSNQQYAADPNEHYSSNPNEQYTSDPNEQYAAGLDEHYGTDPNEQYATDLNDQYSADPNGQYATDHTEQYPADQNEHYATDPNGQYAVDPNEQYGYYENQPYHNDPNATYDDAGNGEYQYSTEQGYQHDSNEQYQHDPNQEFEADPNEQFVADPNQQFEADPNQQYEHDPHVSLAQDPNQEYKEQEHGQNLSYESIGYEQHEQGENREFENDSQENYVGGNVELQASNQNYSTAVTEEQNEIQPVTEDWHNQESSNPTEIRAKEQSADEKKKSKDVIKALLESDTDSTIERNPSNNTESDFDFN